MQVQPYIFFPGCCEEAIAFYRQALGAEVLMKLHFKDAPPNPDCPPAPDSADKIMHATLKIGDSNVMMSDGDGKEGATHTGYHLSIASNDLAAGERYFQALSLGGRVNMPFQATFWALGFGMVIDRFGIPWMINVPRPTV
ncbi:VOC family metalloprotein YjdN [Paludibacterium purpuratum]|uniref:PhnB protein n=1 Tax=Paludibacterium purpuratum TaxID=1144873 RepID=A0A4R7BDA2_9NEIS|nr:VOC family metalloprotein YjdN [Paludibacterium purpuratum]TDR82911.1 PhnB protein [Paludibacterium purpuratum]